MTAGARGHSGRRRGLSVLLVIVSLAGCSSGQERNEMIAMTDGDPERGRHMLRKYGCQSCHTIPGVEGGDARVGPPLAGIANRSFIGGVLPNAPDNMLRWIENPKAVDPLTAMPNVGVTNADARHIAAYLYTLR